MTTTEEKRETSVRREPLPPFQTNLLSSFLFGDPDGKHDDVLTHSALVVKGAREFLTGNKAIVLGERGAGKSALFKLIAEGTFKFSDSAEKQFKSLVVAIDNEVNYLAILKVVEERFTDSAAPTTGKYQFLWEIFLLASTIAVLSEEYKDDLELQTLESDFKEVLGVAPSRKGGLADLFSRYKLTVGTKFDQAGSVTPTLSVEPVQKTSEARAVTDHEVSQFRDRVRKFIRAKKRIVYILVDRVDDFVTDQAYDEQRRNIQALVDTVQHFRYPEMKLKLFLRADIFSKLNFERGVDKIAHQVVRLEWTHNDIAEFVARRLLYNYIRLNIKVPDLGMGMALLDVDPATRDQFLNLFRSQPKSFGQRLQSSVMLFGVALKVKWAQFTRKSYAARKTNSIDEVFKRLITLIFPSRVAHKTMHCKRDEMPVTHFLATHFSLGGAGPNPRLVLLFLQTIFEESANYYARNPDRKSIAPNLMGEYELLLNEHVLSGYRRTQDIARQTLAGLNGRWKRYVEQLFATLQVPVQCENLSLDDIRTSCKWDGDDEEFRRFIAFFAHVGLLEDETKGTGKQYGDRTYEMPIVLRTCGC